MNTDEIRSLLEEVFFEYKIDERQFNKYDSYSKNALSTFFIKKKLTHEYSNSIIYIQPYIIGTTIIDNVWEMIWTLPKKNYSMIIPGKIPGSISDIDVSKSFLMLSKTKMEEVIAIDELTQKLINDLIMMNKEPIKIMIEYRKFIRTIESIGFKIIVKDLRYKYNNWVIDIPVGKQCWGLTYRSHSSLLHKSPDDITHSFIPIGDLRKLENYFNAELRDSKLEKLLNGNI